MLNIWLYYYYYYPILSLWRGDFFHTFLTCSSHPALFEVQFSSELAFREMQTKCESEDGACQLVEWQLKSLGVIIAMRLEPRAPGRVGSKVRKVGWLQTVTTVIVIWKTFKSHRTPALGTISTMFLVKITLSS